MTDSSPGRHTATERRRLRRDDAGTLIDDSSHERVSVASLGPSVVAGERFSVVDAGGNDVTFSVLRDVVATLLWASPSATGRNGTSSIGDVVSAITKGKIPEELLEQLEKQTR